MLHLLKSLYFLFAQAVLDLTKFDIERKEQNERMWREYAMRVRNNWHSALATQVHSYAWYSFQPSRKQSIAHVAIAC